MKIYLSVYMHTRVYIRYYIRSATYLRRGVASAAFNHVAAPHKRHGLGAAMSDDGRVKERAHH